MNDQSAQGHRRLADEGDKGHGTAKMLYDRPAQSLQETLRRCRSGRDNPGAGAALVFDLEGSTAPSDWLFIAGARENDNLGLAVATARVGDRDVVGATEAQNRQQTAVFYCSILGGAGRPSSRCQ